MNKLIQWAAIIDVLRSGRLSRTTLSDATGVVLDLESNQIFKLNEIGVILLETLEDGVTDVDQIAEKIVHHFEVDIVTARRDIEHFFCALQQRLLS